MMPMGGEVVYRCCSELADVETAAGEYGKELAEQDLACILPDDVLAEVLCRLAPRWLAASRCVCRDWRAAIDACRLLRLDLLPLSFSGVFLHIDEQMLPRLFARPSASTGALDFLPDPNTYMEVSKPGYHINWRDCHIQDHCNGLLLLSRHVVNPATRRCYLLPPSPPAPRLVGHMAGHVNASFNTYLVYDPMVSPHYEVFMIPRRFSVGLVEELDDFDPLVKECRWASSPCVFRVFSSETGEWEKRSFVREGRVLGTDAVNFRSLWWRESAVYWRGALYLQREANFVVRISLSSHKYCVIKPPVDMGLSLRPTRYLEKSEQGVYFAALDNYHLRVWVLKESSGQREWMLKYDNDLEAALVRHHGRQVRRPWVLKDVSYNLSCSHPPEYKKKDTLEEEFGWNSDSDDVDYQVKNEDPKQKLQQCSYNDYVSENRGTVEEFHSDDDDRQNFFRTPKITMLGFHPYREIVFLISESTGKGLAYHLSTSKVEGIGNIYPTNYTQFRNFYNQRSIVKYSFSYTPCWLEEFHTNG
ncbi:hypothetical protein QYE76_062412 [Lolium multiflorum]|uniref:F-box domain-containing protein n=1 Tax=Lolium multiflorum TaxID=4521 RepID=A0AAD8S5M7_LOLMU|nr:hypothetical protein QYE76_062412 [Lolium multiflorum]